ncbi:MAG: serine/threonine-protein kinase [Pseudomonadota bacterium]
MFSVETYNVDHLIGQQVGTSTLIKELARGGMGIVFIAYQRTLKRQIAVKILPKSFLSPQTAQRFQQEAEAAAILSHPNIIPIYEVGETNEFLFFTMQLIQGSALSEMLKKTRKHILPSKRVLPLPEAMRITIQVLDALDYAHREGIIHRDIKPENILIEHHTQRPLISDFGIAKVLGGEDVDSAIQGTPVYMAPEQIIGSQLDGRADIYAVGVMLFEMLVPELPLPRYESTISFLRQKVRDRNGIFLKKPSELNPALNNHMDTILQRATAYGPDQRFATCRDFIKSLEWYQQLYLQETIELH